MLKKEINPLKLKKFIDSKRDLEKNQYFKDFKSQWNNEMHYVVDEYKSNIFPNAHEHGSFNVGQQVLSNQQYKTMQSLKKTATMLRS